MARVQQVIPSTQSFGAAVITPRWLYVLAAATGSRWGDPQIVDETLDPLDLDTIAPGDVVGIGIYTGNALHRDEDRASDPGGRTATSRGSGEWNADSGIFAQAHGRADAARLRELDALRQERFDAAVVYWKTDAGSGDSRGAA
jgi:hypothetical protein